MEGVAAAGDESAGTADEDGHRAGEEAPGLDIVTGHADRQVVEAVAVPVAGREARTEELARAGEAAQHDGGVGPVLDLVAPHHAGDRGLGGVAVAHVDAAGGADAVGIVAGHADGEIGGAVAVPVASGEDAAEMILELGRAAEVVLADAVQPPERRSGRRARQHRGGLPACSSPSTVAPMAPITRSTKPSRSKSPLARAMPK